MTIFFSKSKNAFYDDAINPASQIPTDAVQITQAEHQSLLAAQSSGQQITSDANGNPIAVDPKTLMTLAQIQAMQCGVIDAAYAAAVQQPVSFTTAGGVTKQFDADTYSQNVLAQACQGYDMAGAVPAGFYWRSADNVNVPFVLADLKGLYGAMLSQGWSAFQHRVTQKAAIMAATTVAAVEAVVW